jgi:hypothetical protein
MLRRIQNNQYEELNNNILNVEQRLKARMDIIIEEVALTGRSYIEIKDEVQRLSDTEGSLLREPNAKYENRMETAVNS